MESSTRPIRATWSACETLVPRSRCNQFRPSPRARLGRGPRAVGDKSRTGSTYVPLDPPKRAWWSQLPVSRANSDQPLSRRRSCSEELHCGVRSTVGSKDGLQRRFQYESRYCNGLPLNASALGVGIASIVFAVAWLPLTRRDHPARFFPPWQRWGTYGQGARALVVMWFVTGVVLIVIGLTTPQSR